MSTLHTFSGSPFHDSEMLATCLFALAPGDGLLLLEDAVYGAVADSGQAGALAILPPDINVYVLSEDLAARGISAKIRPVFSRVTYTEFVSLCLTHSKVVNWS